MNKEGMSDFQLRQYQVVYFNVTNAIVITEEIQASKLEHTFSREHDLKYDETENQWMGSLHIKYTSECPNLPKGQELSVEIGIVGLFIYKAENSEDQQDSFEKLLRLNGTVSLLGILRGIVAAATSSLGFRPGIIVPSVNLNKLVWDKPEHTKK